MRILDNARFAPSGGNRQGWRVIVVKDEAKRRELKRVMAPTIKQYKTQAMAGETPLIRSTESGHRGGYRRHAGGLLRR